MTPDTIICTVGTSLPTALRREDDGLADLLDQGRVLEAARRIQPRPLDDRRMGAEINSLHRILESGKAEPGKLLLLVSDTGDGRRIAATLPRLSSLAPSVS